MIVRNVIAADEPADTLETSGHLFQTSLVSLLMGNLVSKVRFGWLYRINSCSSISAENRGQGLGTGLRGFLRKCRREGGATTKLSLNPPACRY